MTLVNKQVSLPVFSSLYISQDSLSEQYAERKYIALDIFELAKKSLLAAHILEGTKIQSGVSYGDIYGKFHLPYPLKEDIDCSLNISIYPLSLLSQYNTMRIADEKIVQIGHAMIQLMQDYISVQCEIQKNTDHISLLSHLVQYNRNQSEGCLDDHTIRKQEYDILELDLELNLLQLKKDKIYTQLLQYCSPEIIDNLFLNTPIAPESLLWPMKRNYQAEELSDWTQYKSLSYNFRAQITDINRPPLCDHSIEFTLNPFLNFIFNSKSSEEHKSLLDTFNTINNKEHETKYSEYLYTYTLYQDMIGYYTEAVQNYSVLLANYHDALGLTDKRYDHSINALVDHGLHLLKIRSRIYMLNIKLAVIALEVGLEADHR